ncbi:S9 family peptidase [bacterium]|nr:S9 family peptidase [bacterium]
MAKILTDRPAAGRWILPMLLALFAVGCTQRVELIPREVLFRHADRSTPKLSPDGTLLAWVAEIDGNTNLVVSQLGDTTRQILTNHEKESVTYFYWVDDGKRIVYFTGMQGYKMGRLNSVDIETGDEFRLLDPPEDAKATAEFRFYEMSSDEPWNLAVGLNWRDPAVFDLYRLNVRTGETTLIEKGRENLLWWFVDGTLTPRGYTISEPDGGQSFYLRNERNGRYKKEITWAIEDDSGQPVGFSPDGKGIYIYDSRGYNSTGLAYYDLETQESTRLVGDERYDVRGVVYDPVTWEIQAARVLAEKSRWVAIADEVKEDFSTLVAARPGNLNILSRTKDDSLWVVAYVYDTSPIEYFIYHRADKSLEKLFNSRDDLADYPLAPMEPIQFKARDGLTIEGYLTRPIGKTGPGPLVVLPHGGPWSRDFWGFNADAQWLANRGYTCLQVNFRGSTGYGKEFVNAGNREWGGKIQDDITDGVQWAIGEGYTRAGEIGIYGGSFGGYAALAGVTYTPELYACAVSVVGPVDVLDYLSSYPPAWNAYRSNLDRRVGYVPRYTSGPRTGEMKDSTDWTESDRNEVEYLQSISPFYNTDKITTPLLIAQGGRDFLVRQQVTEEFVKKLREKDLPVDYIVYENSGHGLSSLEDRVDFIRRAEAFLAAYLGGRFEK